MDFEKLKNYRNEKNSFANMIGLKITDIQLGTATACMEVSEKTMNPINSVHGGCLYSAADVAAGAAASSYGQHVTTLDSSFHYLRAGLNTKKIIAVARECKHGKRVMVFNVTVSDQDGIVLCESIFTFMPLEKKIEF